mmetsp:Transcript_41656/g.99823  ORF Transcript_41656/g.99823 Transcript_41656/m.99823 type:complete len:694 (-) Transcript_41656:37-2118(-)
MRLFLTGFVVVSAVSPVEKVVKMLKKMQSEIEHEAQEEATAYDKYACFCKEQADEFLYTTTKSQKKIDELTASIDDLSAKINTLNGQVSTANTDITTIEGNMRTEQNARDTEKATYDAEDQDLRTALDECDNAIKALKKSMKATSLTQTVADAAIALPETAFSADERQMISSLLQAPGEAKSYAFHSQDIIALLMKMQQVFKQKKSEKDAEETAARQTFEMAQQKRALLKGNLEKNVREMQATIAGLSEEKTAHEKDRAEETQKKTDDSAFLSDLTAKCEAKATSWDARSADRTNELTAVSDAIKALTEEGGATDSYDANKKLTLAQRKAVQPHQTSAGVTAFVQLAAVAKNRRAMLVVDFLRKQAHTQQSIALARLASQISRDPFKKVRDLISDLIAKLEEQGREEQRASDFCDTEMSSASAARDAAKANVESLEASITRFETEIEELKQEIADLEQENADLKNQNKEATEIRDKERSDNEATIEEAQSGSAAVQRALTALSNYYSFLQQPTGYQRRENTHEAGADASGQTVDDKAPNEPTSEAHSGQGNQAIGFLQVIKADFDRTVSTVTALDGQSQTDFEAGVSNRNTEIGLNEGEIASKTAAKTTAEQNLFDDREDLTEEEASLKLAKQALEQLKPQCVSGPVDFRERTERRNQEIDSLKNALEILEESTADVQTTSLKAVDFMQKRHA